MKTLPFGDPSFASSIQLPRRADGRVAPAMTDLAVHSDVLLRPDPSRTVIRPFHLEDPEGFVVEGHSRSQRIVDRVLALDPTAVAEALARAMSALDMRHDDVEEELVARARDVDGVVLECDRVDRAHLALIGAYFSEEFSFESAALFNPSVVRHPDQGGVAPGALRFLMSLRGIGEGHVSSLTFRAGIWDADGTISVEAPSRRAHGPKFTSSRTDTGERVIELRCGGNRQIADAVIFPFLPSQGLGIEDLRLVEFTEDDGTTDYRGTYTSFSGSQVREVLLKTSDFRTIQLRGVEGPWARSKGMAMFPRRIGGRYMMLGRQDNESIWLLSSDDPCSWSGGEKLVQPRYPWEFILMGNCGSPIEIDEGWLVITHGVGMVRTYAMGACLLDKDDPSRVIGRTARPILEPSADDRDGYVPNVVYSCGALLRDRTLLLPYGVADNFTKFVTIEIDALLGAMS